MNSYIYHQNFDIYKYIIFSMHKNMYFTNDGAILNITLKIYVLLM